MSDEEKAAASEGLEVLIKSHDAYLSLQESRDEWCRKAQERGAKIEAVKQLCYVNTTSKEKLKRIFAIVTGADE